MREQLGHPVLDGDGHVVELNAVFTDYCRDHGAGDLIDQVPMLRPRSEAPSWVTPKVTPEERRRYGMLPVSWHVAAEASYVAAVSLPSQYYERLPEAGIDYSVLYPTLGLMIHRLPQDEPRIGLSRLYNQWQAEQFAPYQDRFTVAAIIPAHTPDEAIEAMEHAKSLGAKVALIPSHIRRPLPGAGAPDPTQLLVAAPHMPGGWIDAYGLDSKYEYDPMWEKAIELGLPIATHSSGMGLNDRASTSNYLFNQIGHFSASGGALAKALFLGGVTRRFPELRVALLEGGVSSGVEIFIRLTETWKKRGTYAIERLDPGKTDRKLYASILEDAAPELLERYDLDDLLMHGPAKAHDDFELTGVQSAEDIRDQWTTAFYWGCEADDPLLGMAADPRYVPLGGRIPTIFGSDIGHWDVEDFDEPLEEAVELLDNGVIDETTLREFVFTNPVKFLTATNPDFFAGTVIEDEARAERVAAGTS
jgi:predicted TIM-barrel fold metal-dependent hydrolase